MTPKTIIFVLCLCLIIACAITLALALFSALFSKYLVSRVEKLEAQNEYKTELLCTVNNLLDEARADYTKLEIDYKKLMYERTKENGRG